MGNCVGKEDNEIYEDEDGIQRGTFTVTNINDDHRLVHKGKMVVTATELIYIDNKTEQEWEWPFKYLRRYGCEGNVFSFEAGRKCANGEGTYAFICKKANVLFNMVAKNITHGGVQPDIDNNNNGNIEEFPFPRPSTTSPHPPEPDPPPLPPFHPPSPGIPSPPDTAPTDIPTDPTAHKNYSDLIFTNESSEPIPSVAGDHAPYSKISFEETEKLSRGGKKIPVNDIRLGGGGGGGVGERRHSSSKKSKKQHGRKSHSPCSSTSSITLEVVPKYPSVSESILEGGDTHTESSYQNLTIEAERRRGSVEQPTYTNIDIGTGEVLPPDTQQQQVAQQPDYTNITIGVVSAELDQPNYENLRPGQGITTSTPVPVPTASKSDYLNYTITGEMTTPPSTHQPDYTNITPGPDVAASLDAPNYLNIKPGPNVSSSIEIPSVRSNTFTHHSLDHRHRSTSALSDTQTYIELDIAKPSQYAQLDIGGGGGGRVVSEKGGSLNRERSSSSSAVTHPQTDSTHQDYTLLNFEAMAAIQTIREEREHDIQEREREAREKANKKGMKKGK